MLIRRAIISDIPCIREIFTETIKTINLKDYTVEEAEDWASCGESIVLWENFLGEHEFWVAEFQGELVGFSSINSAGYIHSLYVHKNFQSRGIASALYSQIEQLALQRNISSLSSDVSITALPFFQQRGFVILKEQMSKAKRLYLKNYLVEKSLELPRNEFQSKSI